MAQVLGDVQQFESLVKGRAARVSKPNSRIFSDENEVRMPQKRAFRKRSNSEDSQDTSSRDADQSTNCFDALNGTPTPPLPPSTSSSPSSPLSPQPSPQPSPAAVEALSSSSSSSTPALIKSEVTMVAEEVMTQPRRGRGRPPTRFLNGYKATKVNNNNNNRVNGIVDQQSNNSNDNMIHYSSRRVKQEAIARQRRPDSDESRSLEENSNDMEQDDDDDDDEEKDVESEDDNSALDDSASDDDEEEQEEEEEESDSEERKVVQRGRGRPRRRGLRTMRRTSQRTSHEPRKYARKNATLALKDQSLINSLFNQPKTKSGKPKGRPRKPLAASDLLSALKRNPELFVTGQDCKCEQRFQLVLQKLDEAHQNQLMKLQQELDDERKHQLTLSVRLASSRKENEMLRNKLDCQQAQSETYQELVSLRDSHAEEISRIKRNHWCTVCEKEAAYYCCWNNSYCSTSCQRTHWLSGHMNKCPRRKKKFRSSLIESTS